MVVMTKPAQKNIIDMMGGVLDFYEAHPNHMDNRTIPVCRKWPIYRADRYPESSKLMQPYFAYSAKIGQYMSQSVRDAYALLTVSSGLTIRDYITRCYLNRNNL